VYVIILQIWLWINGQRVNYRKGRYIFFLKIIILLFFDVSGVIVVVKNLGNLSASDTMFGRIHTRPQTLKVFRFLKLRT